MAFEQLNTTVRIEQMREDVFVHDTTQTGVTNTVATISGSTGQLTTPTWSAMVEYVSGIGSGFGGHLAVKVATTGVLSATYDNGASGVGATLTNNSTQEALSIDGVSLSLGDRVLVKDQGTTFQNGIYEVTTVGDGSSNWVLTRTSDFDNSPASEIMPGDFFPVESGTSNGGKQYYQVAFDGSTDTIGTDAITFTLFSNPTDLSAGNGIDSTQFASNTVAIELNGTSDGTSGLKLTASGLSISDNIDGNGLSLASGVLSIDGAASVTITGDWNFSGGELVLPTSIPVTHATTEGAIYYDPTSNALKVYDTAEAAFVTFAGADSVNRQTVYDNTASGTEITTLDSGGSIAFQDSNSDTIFKVEDSGGTTKLVWIGDSSENVENLFAYVDHVSIHGNSTGTMNVGTTPNPWGTIQNTINETIGTFSVVGPSESYFAISTATNTAVIGSSINALATTIYGDVTVSNAGTTVSIQDVSEYTHDYYVRTSGTSYFGITDGTNYLLKVSNAATDTVEIGTSSALIDTNIWGTFTVGDGTTNHIDVNGVGDITIIPTDGQSFIVSDGTNNLITVARNDAGTDTITFNNANIDFSDETTSNLVLPTSYAGSVEGAIYFDGTNDVIKVHDGTSAFYTFAQVDEGDADTGDVLYWNATSGKWVPLDHGTSGDVLTTQGAGSAPSWATPNYYSGFDVSGDTGSTSTIASAGTLTIAGGTALSTSASGTSVTINSTLEAVSGTIAATDGEITYTEVGGAADEYDSKTILFWSLNGIVQTGTLTIDGASDKFTNADIKIDDEVVIVLY